MLTPVETISIFQKQPEPQVFSAGQVIFEEGQPGDVMYGIIEGEVELYLEGKVVETIKESDVFGEGALVQETGDRASTAIAKTDCRLAILDEKRFLFVIQETPMFALGVIRSYSTRLRRLKREV